MTWMHALVKVRSSSSKTALTALYLDGDLVSILNFDYDQRVWPMELNESLHFASPLRGHGLVWPGRASRREIA